jgi:hypothetical protein
MAKGYIQSYSGFIGADMSSDPRAVARNRLAYSVNMWRDYESDQGEAIETFPGFRIAVNALSDNVHGLYHYRTRSGVDYVIAHFGEKLYAFEKKKLAAGECTADNGLLEEVQLADADSTGFVYNNNLYILDGSSYWVVTTQGIDSNETVVAKNALKVPYIPTTYYNGKPYEQRNMLTNSAYQIDIKKWTPEDAETRFWVEINDDMKTAVLRGSCLHPHKICVDIESGLASNIPDGYSLYISGDITRKETRIVVRNGANIGTLEISGQDDVVEVYVPSSLEVNKIYCYSTKILYLFTVLESDHDKIEIEGPGQVIYGTFDATDYNEVVIGAKEQVKDFNKKIIIYEPATSVESIYNSGTLLSKDQYIEEKSLAEINGESREVISGIYFKETIFLTEVKVKLKIIPGKFAVNWNVTSPDFEKANPDYKKTSIEAIKGCTKAAVYDGRVFLTGNPDLPNTTFYTHRNLTGANDPAYFGVYNYFNDGVGNTPNVELLALPSMLMVLKNDTLSDGSIYYHVGQFNTDEDTMGLLPRIYPATTGAAGLGSVGENDPGERRGNTTCNFLDDPVFLSRRGLEAVGKEQVNLERAVTHRSSNVDRLLIKENLSEASIAEWKGYLVICVNGNMYLADSRHMSQHPDGSVQYEWYYLEGLKTYETYAEAYKYLESPGVFTDEEWANLKDEYHLKRYEEYDDRDEIFWGSEVKRIGGVLNSGDLYFREVNGVKYILERAGDERVGNGEAYPAKKIIAVGQHLIFGTDRGDLCIINTDKRGESVGERKVKADAIDYTWYTFAGVRYVSGCSTKLDDCDQKIYTKTTIPGTTTVRFKTMLNSSCKINSRVDGENWSEVGSAVNYLGRATGSELDFGDINFANFAFAGNDNNVVVVPEISRCWINKQYYVYSDGYAAPFGLYELSYAYKSGGRIRY